MPSNFSSPIKKAVFPVAGLGTRFLPATKANPKEMMPVVDKPLIQYAVEEAVSAGINQLIFVTNSSKRAIEDHFDTNFELEQALEKNDKQDLLAEVKSILPAGVSCVYIRQPQALGLGHAVLCAKDVVGKEPFAVLLADDLIQAKTPCLKQMVEAYINVESSIVALETIAKEDSEKYGIVGVREARQPLVRVQSIIEKPIPTEAPSNLGVVGRYILQHNIFDILEDIPKGRGGEIQLTDALSEMLSSKEIYGYQFSGKRFDCGSKFGYLQAVVQYGLKHPHCGKDFEDYLQKVAGTQLCHTV